MRHSQKQTLNIEQGASAAKVSTITRALSSVRITLSPHEYIVSSLIGRWVGWGTGDLVRGLIYRPVWLLKLFAFWSTNNKQFNDTTTRATMTTAV